MSPLEQVDYRDGETALTGWLARPEDTPRAAVLVFPTIMNPSPAVQAKTRALANSGYLALIADFYGEPVGDFPAAMRLAAGLRSDVEHYRKRLRAALGALERLSDGLPRAAIGFCMGGQAVLELARENAPLDVVVSFHGLLDTGCKAPAGGPVGPRILVCHGDADALVPRAQVTGFWEKMDTAGANWHFHSYAGVGHGFTNPQAPPAGGPSSYNASADRQSWAAALSLFDEVFADG